MYRIAKSFTFSASHQLTHLPPSHPCARLHGHNYTVVLVLQGPGIHADTGMLLDFRDLAQVKTWIDDVLDHRHLNDVLGGGERTTSERLAKWIFDTWSDRYRQLVCVRVRETDKTCAEYWTPERQPCGLVAP